MHNDIHHERHGAHFSAGTEDSVWLPFVGEKGWILLTKDKRIRFNDLEKRAVIAAPGAGVLFYFGKLQRRGDGSTVSRSFA